MPERPAAKVSAEDIGGNPVEPGGELALVAKPMELMVDFDEGLLGQIIRVIDVSSAPVHELPDLFLVIQDQLVKGALIPTQKLIDKDLVVFHP